MTNTSDVPAYSLLEACTVSTEDVGRRGRFPVLLLHRANPDWPSLITQLHAVVPVDGRRPFVAFAMALDRSLGADAVDSTLQSVCAWRALRNSAAEAPTVIVEGHPSLGSDLADRLSCAAFDGDLPQARLLKTTAGSPVLKPHRTRAPGPAPFTERFDLETLPWAAMTGRLRDYSAARAIGRQLLAEGSSRAEVKRHLSVFGYLNASGNAGAWDGPGALDAVLTPESAK